MNISARNSYGAVSALVYFNKLIQNDYRPVCINIGKDCIKSLCAFIFPDHINGAFTSCNSGCPCEHGACNCFGAFIWQLSRDSSEHLFHTKNATGR